MGTGPDFGAGNTRSLFENSIPQRPDSKARSHMSGTADRQVRLSCEVWSKAGIQGSRARAIAQFKEVLKRKRRIRVIGRDGRRVSSTHRHFLSAPYFRLVDSAVAQSDFLRSDFFAGERGFNHDRLTTVKRCWRSVPHMKVRPWR